MAVVYIIETRVGVEWLVFGNMSAFRETADTMLAEVQKMEPGEQFRITPYTSLNAGDYNAGLRSSRDVVISYLENGDFRSLPWAEIRRKLTKAIQRREIR